MPRKKKSPKIDSAVAITEPLEHPKDEIPAPKEAAEYPRAEQDPTPQEVITHPERDPIRQETTHAEAVLARRPSFAPVPEGWKNVATHVASGIKVNKGVDHPYLGSASLQFAEDRPLSRATEYDLMTQVQDAGFSYKPQSRQWERPKPEGMTAGENVIDAGRIAKELDAARDEGRGR